MNTNSSPSTSLHIKGQGRKSNVDLSGSLLIKASVATTPEIIERAIENCLGNSVSFLHIEMSSFNTQLVVVESDVASLDERLPRATLLQRRCDSIVRTIHALAPGAVRWISGFRLQDTKWFHHPTGPNE